MHLDAPRGFRDSAFVDARMELLATSEAVKALETWARDLEERRRGRQPDIVVPHFDPAEAGVGARALLLLEAPGPQDGPRVGRFRLHLRRQRRPDRTERVEGA